MENEHPQRVRQDHYRATVQARQMKWVYSKLVGGVGAGFCGLQARLTHTMDAVCRQWLVYSAKPALAPALAAQPTGGGFSVR